MIERKIVIGLIVSTEFNQRIKGKWDVALFESSIAKRLASWCLDYFNKYNKAPGREIESILYAKAGKGLQKEIIQEIEEDILPGLSEEYVNDDFNVEYYTDKALQFFNERNLIRFSDKIKGLAEQGLLYEAENMASGYRPLSKEMGNCINFEDKENVMNKIGQVFNKSTEVLIQFPKELGRFWNDQFVRDGFVAFLAPEKRGKTWWLLECAKKACTQKRKVAFFQAGDMTEHQQLKRICISLKGKSDNEKYTGEFYIPVIDCIHNQLDNCDKEERECSFGLFRNKDENYRYKITMKELKEVYKNNKDYKNCFNCKEFNKNPWGTPFIKKIKIKEPLTEDEAKEAIEKFFIKNKRSFRLSTHVNGSLGVNEIRAILGIWEKQDNFVPDVIIIDYADLLEDNSYKEERHKQNHIWKQLRGLGQEKHCLILTATQADAESYAKDTLRMTNFSEDKRKYGHVTAMYGLNQDAHGREKEIGIMRINEIVIREGDFNIRNQIHVLQNLRCGRPFIGSFW
jgi:hypothetical protein